MIRLHLNEAQRRLWLGAEAAGLGAGTPYGVYDVAANAGRVPAGTDHDTAAFAVQPIRTWWRNAGQPAYPAATRLRPASPAMRLAGPAGTRLSGWTLAGRSGAGHPGQRGRSALAESSVSVWTTDERLNTAMPAMASAPPAS